MKGVCAAFLWLQFGFVIFWHKNIGAKAACKILMKLTAVVNFTNILLAFFRQYSSIKKITRPNCK